MTVLYVALRVSAFILKGAADPRLRLTQFRALLERRPFPGFGMCE